MTGRAYPAVLGLYQFYVAPTKLIKSRTVYNWITLLSEVSGFADILILFPSFALGIFYTPVLKNYAMARSAGMVDFPRKRLPDRHLTNISVLLQVGRYR